MYLVVGISQIGVRSDTPFSHMIGHRNTSAAYSTVGRCLLALCFFFLPKLSYVPFLLARDHLGKLEMGKKVSK